MKAMIMLHGRGATADNILRLKKNFPDMIYYAPQAPGNEWYPKSFLEPRTRNEPSLSKSLASISDAIKILKIELKDLYILGFSQGACLALQFAYENPARYAGIIAFSGGLIGDNVSRSDSSLEGTPVFIGISEHDPFIPKKRAEESAEILAAMHANVTTMIYRGSTHHVSAEEIDAARKMVKSS